ncbi:coiled-coil domain-containing protein [Helicobacter pylori]|uniref:coiled-coil domain-containing protein n=1 Tax=Helicobacter pylori TaxID=210 RepID=UPI000C312849|nr:hypothetical protein [Helicobacter pylori]WRE55164.1 hypothetical protein KVC90_03180 [Helicobacter pylori]
MDLKGLENALNNGNFKEQVYSSLEGIYQISKVLNQLDLLKNFTEHDLEIKAKIQAIKNTLAGYETSEQELKAQINALVDNLEAKKQELEALLNTQLQSALQSEKEKLTQAGSALKNNLINELTQAGSALKNNLINELTQAGSALKNNLINELTQAKNNLALELEKLKVSAQRLLNTPRMQGVNLKFLGIYVYGSQTFFKNESDEFRELFEIASIHLGANKSYIVQFSMPYELATNGIYSESMGEMVLCLKAGSKVYPIANSFYQNKTVHLNVMDIIVDTYRVNSIFKTPSEEANYKIAVYARKHKDLWLNVNYTNNTQGLELSFLTNAHFSNLTTQSLPTDYNNDWVFYKHTQALIYEVLK